jgi:acyl phosphate:glycerol-3-phosphate acyltransferase
VLPLAVAVAPYINGMPGSRAAHVVRPRGLGAHPHLLNSVVVILPFCAIAAVAYLLGSIPFGYLLMRIFRKQDIRSIGSGNIGATNVIRSGARGLGIATFILDVLKGGAAVLLAAPLGLLLAHDQMGFLLDGVIGGNAELRNLQAVAALFAVLGHMFPIWLKFRGGKGVATGFGVFLFICPWAALASIATFFAVFGITRYVAIASIVGAAAFPIFAWFLLSGERPPFFFAAAIAVSLLIIVKHHTNIRRLFAGTEYRFGAPKSA